ncbi:glycosyltransferase family 9 protein [Wenzhouxiangella sp. XN79A]|uniref:glycosyltransferase family 9 protein n=1 Tax=Wenzhouxiangella sp. XN79A TaxID=2724193 RepID=UPI00144A9C54|nr:glycosyltransferase family 9 protein [Wenzhouxiangella sp. XN79A]NKI36053.1 glycosyltransferase family 9 protein [Wenzhouxiangella sp. XN79A]
MRLSALGDVCHCIALVRTLQRAFPDASITWIIGRSEHRLAEAMGGVEFIVLDKKTGRRGRRSVRRALRGRRFDVLLQAQVSARASLLSLSVRADRRIGFDRDRSREGHGLVVNERIRAVPLQHQAEAMLEFARALGAATDGIDRAPPVAERDREFARIHQPEADRAVLISPCSSHPGRNWSAERYAAIADHIIERHGRPVILVGGPSRIERQTADAIAAAMTRDALDLVGQDTLGQALAMLERAACLIAPDSGPVHFAAALGTPVVGLYAATWSKRSGPLGSLEHCVDRFPEAARRFMGKAPEDLRWGKRIERDGVMDLVTVADVTARIDALLDG